MLDIGEMFSEKKGAAYHDELKYTAKYIKSKVDDYKPYLDMFKTVYKMMN